MPSLQSVYRMGSLSIFQTIPHRSSADHEVFPNDHAVSERPELGRKSPSFAVSILVHGAVIALVAYGLLHPPPLRNRILDER